MASTKSGSTLAAVASRATSIPGIGLSRRERRGDAGVLDQVGGFLQCEDRFRVPILILDELECMTEVAERRHGRLAAR